MGPLAGIRVIEMAGIGPIPFAGMLLSDLGAEVIRIDRPQGVGLFTVTPDKDSMSRGRRSAIIDLRQPEGVEALLSLIVEADVLIEGHRPGTMERLQLGPDVCLARNPRLIYGRMTGWGQHGPLAKAAGHDISYIALTGALHAIGEAPRPTPPLNVLGDFAGGSTYLVIGVLAALLRAQTSGQGEVVDAAIVDGVASLMSMTYAMFADGSWVDSRQQNMLDGGLPWYAVYETADGKHVAVGALEEKFYGEMTQALGLSREEASRQESNLDALRGRLSAIFKSQTRDYWSGLFEGTDACVAPVLSLEEAPLHPHNQGARFVYRRKRSTAASARSPDSPALRLLLRGHPLGQAHIPVPRSPSGVSNHRQNCSRAGRLLTRQMRRRRFMIDVAGGAPALCDASLARSAARAKNVKVHGFRRHACTEESRLKMQTSVPTRE